MMTTKKRRVETTAAIAYLQELIAQAEASGQEIKCVALRVTKDDGSFDDVVFGGTEEEREAALVELQSRDNLH